MPSLEKVIHSQLADYINLQFPDVIFLSDPSGMRLSVGLRNEVKRKRCRKYKIPDLIILHPSKGYKGLIIEVKATLEDVFKKDGTLKAGDHLKEQQKSIDRLNELGYLASFGPGFDYCKNLIDNYLK